MVAVDTIIVNKHRKMSSGARLRHMGYAKNPDDFARRVVDEAFAALPDGLSLREVGRRTGIDHSQLSRLRDYKRMLDVDQLEALCIVAGVAPHVIVERAENGGGQVLAFPGKPRLSPSGSTVESPEQVERAALGHDVEAEIEAQQDQP